MILQVHYAQEFSPIFANSVVHEIKILAKYLHPLNWYIYSRATENRFFAGSDRFLVCKTDSICIKRIFFGPKKNTLCGSYTGPISWISRVKPLIVHNYSNYQCCHHIRVTEISQWIPISLLKLIHLSLLRVYWSVSNWIFDTNNISWHCLIFYLSAYIGNVSLFTRVRGIIWHITQMGKATTIFLCKG